MGTEPGGRIRRQRREIGWSQAELAKKAGLSPSFLSEVETGKRGISGSNLVRIAEALGVRAGFLLTGEGEVESETGPVEIPQELAQVAVEEGLSYSTTISLLQMHKAAIARRSRDERAPDKDYWRRLLEAWRMLDEL